MNDVDRGLVSAFLGSRDEGAFRALYRAHTPALHRIARRLQRGDTRAADDVIQTTWIRAIGRLEEFRWRSSLRTWLIGILINCSRESLRERSGPAASREDGTGARAPLEHETRPERIDLERAIAALPDGYRDVLILHDIEGHGHREIAGLLGISEGTSKSQLSHARAAVRARLGRRQPARPREEETSDDDRTAR